MYVFDDEISKTLNEIVKIQKSEKKEVSDLQKAFFFFKKIKKIFLVPKLQFLEVLGLIFL